MPSHKENIIVYVNGRPVEIYRGLKVKHALISLDYPLYKSVRDGESAIEDENGFRVRLEGALSDGSKIFTRPRQSQDH